MRSELKPRWSEYPMQASERPKRMFEYFVTGHGTFPFDMMRYDSCWPASGEDAARLDWEYANPTRARENRSVRMRSYREPTIDRWSSFGWSVGNENLNPQRRGL